MEARGALGTLLALALLTGCGSWRATDEQATGVGAGTETSSGSPDPLLVSCGGGPGWPPSVMTEGVDSDFADEARETFADLLAEPGLGEELGLTFLADGPDTEFRVLRDDGDAVTLGLGRWTDEAGPVDGALVLSLARETDGWSVGGGSDCGLEPVVAEGAAWVELVGPVATSDGGRTLDLRVTERACTSARDPRPHLRKPDVTATADAVVVSWTSTAVPGGADCPGNPVVAASVALDEPLGERAVLDGSIWPPRPLARGRQ